MIKFVNCEHKNCGNLVYSTASFQKVYNSKIEFLLKLNPELKRFCNGFHGYASHSKGYEAGIKDPCKCSICITQKIKLDQNSKKFSEQYKKHMESLKK